VKKTEYKKVTVDITMGSSTESKSFKVRKRFLRFVPNEGMRESDSLSLKLNRWTKCEEMFEGGE